MKTLRLGGFLFFALFLICCEESPRTLGDFKLLPYPQQFEITGVSNIDHTTITSYHAAVGLDLPAGVELLKNSSPATATDAQLLLDLDASLDLKAEGYALEVAEDRIKITGKDKAGLFYGLMSLEQLLEDASEQQVNLPLCSITDYPLLTYRAIQLDVKHHREKKEYYYAIIDKLARYKVNAIIAEFEDKIAYQSQPLIGSADALSMSEWKQLSDYASARNISISPLVQGLGHASFILKHEEYKHLRDDPKSDWAFNPLDPGTYDVQFDLYRDAIAVTPHGRYLHVGGDEVHTTGRNSGKSALELQLIWLNKVCEFSEEMGRIPIFWDDMPLKHAGVYEAMFKPEMSKEVVEEVWEKNEHRLAEFLDLFPKNCIYMRWNYVSPQALGNSKAMDWFQKHGMEVMGATAGQRRWVLMPQDGGNIENIKTFARSSIENNLEGLLLTLWDDDSPHFELYWRGILAFAEYTWAGEKRSRKELLAAYRHREFAKALSDDSYAFVDQLEAAVVFYKDAFLEDADRNHLTKLKNPKEAVIALPDRKPQGKWSSEYAERVEKAEKILKISDTVASKIETMQAKADRNSYTLEVYEQVNHLASFAPRALLVLRAYDAAQNQEQVLEAIREINRLSAEFSSLRKELEDVYAKTRILEKPRDYILDQDHHVHLANQGTTFDWQFYAERVFLDKLQQELLDETPAE